MTQYSEEFKQSSAKLAKESTQSISETAQELGIKVSTLHGWVNCYYPSSSVQEVTIGAELAAELKSLRKENARLKQKRDILKKAAACVPQAQQHEQGAPATILLIVTQ